MRIALVDCDHDSFQPEIELAREQSVELVIALSADTDELVEHAQGADGILMQYAPITGEVLDRLPDLRAIGRYGVGFDTIDVQAATDRGVAVCSVPDYGSESVSDHAIALALSVLRGVVALDRGIRRGEHDFSVVRPLHEIQGRTFGVIGLGAIGRAVARKAEGLGFRVIGYDIAPQRELIDDAISLVDLDSLLAESDVISLHTPLDATSGHLIGARQLSLMRKEAVLVNTSRGGVVDTAALVEALETGAILGAGLDVLEDEPIGPGHPLLEFDSVVVTPHTAWYSEESYLRLKQRTLQNVIDVCAGRTPRTILNPSVLKGRSTS